MYLVSTLVSPYAYRDEADDSRRGKPTRYGGSRATGARDRSPVVVSSSHSHRRGCHTLRDAHMRTLRSQGSDTPVHRCAQCSTNTAITGTGTSHGAHPANTRLKQVNRQATCTYPAARRLRAPHAHHSVYGLTKRRACACHLCAVPAWQHLFCFSEFLCSVTRLDLGSSLRKQGRHQRVHRLRWRRGGGWLRPTAPCRALYLRLARSGGHGHASMLAATRGLARCRCLAWRG
jgi:hypothetical protein